MPAVAVSGMPLVVPDQFDKRRQKFQQTSAHPGFIGGTGPGRIQDGFQLIGQAAVFFIAKNRVLSGQACQLEQMSSFRPVKADPAVLPGIIAVGGVVDDLGWYGKKALPGAKLIAPSAGFVNAMAGDDIVDQEMVPDGRSPAVPSGAFLDAAAVDGKPEILFIVHPVRMTEHIGRHGTFLLLFDTGSTYYSMIRLFFQQRKRTETILKNFLQEH